MQDKNGIKIKHRDIVKIAPSWLSSKVTICAIKKNPVRLWVYNPNCCLICRNGVGAYGTVSQFKSREIEIIGNLDDTPELLPLKEMEED